MRRPAVFFDRDNTLIVGHDYIGDPARVELVSGAPAAVAKCRQMGFAVVVVSNQSGVARGMFTEDDVRACNRKLDALLLASNGGAVIDRHEYCPYHPEAKVEKYRQDSFLRKPKPGMILAAAEAMALDLANSWVVGDAPRDIAAGKAAGCRAILIVDERLTPSPAALETGADAADFVVKSLSEAIDVIAEQINKPLPPPKPAEPPKAPTPASIPEAKPQPTPPPPPADAPIEVAPAAPVVPAQMIAEAFAPPAPSPRSEGNGRPSTEPRREPRAEPKPVERRPAETKPAEPRPTESRNSDLSRLETTNQQILMELKKLAEIRHDDFSLSKLVAGIVQILAVAAVPLAYVMYRAEAQTMQLWLLVAIFLQLLTIAMLIMGRQR